VIEIARHPSFSAVVIVVFVDFEQIAVVIVIVRLSVSLTQSVVSVRSVVERFVVSEMTAVALAIVLHGPCLLTAGEILIAPRSSNSTAASVVFELIADEIGIAPRSSNSTVASVVFELIADEVGIAPRSSNSTAASAVFELIADVIETVHCSAHSTAVVAGSFVVSRHAAAG
jgi:hypothetical protein